MADDTQLFINNWSTTISDATVAVDAVTINIPSADSATLGAIAANEYFVATLSDGSNLEVVWITANNETGALTVVRAKEDTSGLAYTSGDTIEIRNTKGTYQNFVQRDAAETLTQKTLTSPVLNTGVSGTGIKDQATLASNSATHIATQQSIKTYVDSASPASHATTHILGGGDELDGDKLDIDWSPAYYTPATNATTADNLDHLTSHLKGIDTAINTKASSTHATTHILGGGDEVDGDKLDIDWIPAYYTPATNSTTADNLDHLTSHLKGIDTAVNVAGGISNIVEDTTPQLGGDLDINSKGIKFASPATITDCKDEDDMSSNSDTMLATQQSIKTYTDTKASATHATTHTIGGGDELDGDKLDIDYTPTYYTPATNSTTADNLDHLTAHLKGIDTKCNDARTTNMEDNILQRPKLLDYGETLNAIGSIATSTHTIDIESGNVVSATLATASTLTFSNPPASGTAGSFTLLLTNGGAYTVTWPTTIDWAGGTAPSLTAAGIDWLTFASTNATTWAGFVAGLDVKDPA